MSTPLWDFTLILWDLQFSSAHFDLCINITCVSHTHTHTHSAIIPCIFVLPAILGAMCMSFACVCYFIAAINGEEWKAPSLAWGPGATSKKDEEPTVRQYYYGGR